MAFTLPLARLGIVGGGQLARMLSPACSAHQVQLTILDPEPKSPAGQFAHAQIEGALHDPDALAALCGVSDVVTFDLEDVGADILMAIAAQGKTMVPSPEVIKRIQNKWVQKTHYREHGIATAPFVALTSEATFETAESFGLPCVQKACVGGYDGRGVHIIKNRADWDRRLHTDSFLEHFVDGGTELAVMVARNASGDMVAYDPVEMVVDPELNLLDYLLAPARVSYDVANAAQQLAKETVASFASPGLFGVELFLTASGELWVNEVAPRAHNSGHHTIEACVTSQFENQLRACLNLPLGDPALRASAVMMNVVGEPGFQGAPVIEGLEELLAEPDCHLHLYGKSQCRPGRKMGHITWVGSDREAVIERALKMRDRIRIRGAEAI